MVQEERCGFSCLLSFPKALMTPVTFIYWYMLRTTTHTHAHSTVIDRRQSAFIRSTVATSIMTHNWRRSLVLVSHLGIRVEILSSISLATAGPLLVMVCHLLCWETVSCMLCSDAFSSSCCTVCTSHCTALCLRSFYYLTLSSGLLIVICVQ